MNEKTGSSEEKNNKDFLNHSLKIAEELLRDGMSIKEVSAVTELSEILLKKIVKEKNIVIRESNFIQQ